MTDFKILKAMRKYGGGFATQLAIAAYCADDENLARIKAAFPDLWEKYAKFAEIDEQKTNQPKGEHEN